MLQLVLTNLTLGGDPELKYFDNGNAVCNVSVAHNTSRKVNEEWVNDTQWFKLAIWGASGENFANALLKGNSVNVHVNKIEAQAYNSSKTNQPEASIVLTVQKWEKVRGAGGAKREDNTGEDSEIYGTIDDFLGKSDASTDF